VAEVDLFTELIAAVEFGLCAAVAVVLGIRWRRERARATASAFGVFAVVALVIGAGWVQPADVTGGWGAVWSDLLVSVLLAIPYLLVRFTWVLGGLRDRTHALLAGLLALEVLLTLLLPPLPQEGAPRPGWFGPYLVLVLGAWSVQCVVAAVGLWRSGRGQPSVVRHRMRALSTGGLLLALTLVLSGAGGEDVPAAYQVAMSLLGLTSIGLFAVAFLPPRALRLIWRQADVAVLAHAERGLMTALTRDDVAATIVPALGRAFGSSGAALLDDQGAPVRAVGLEPAQLAELAVLLDDAGGARLPVQDAGVLCARLSRGWLVVQAGRLAPVFGEDELVLLERVGTLVDLALQRAALFEQERLSRRMAEAANGELETLLYSVSHDLRSPLISVLGYLDVLRQEQGATLTGDGAHYLERISVNAVYMQSLISDLLELSRIGRSDPPAQRLDLHAVAEQVLDGARMTHPQARLEVTGRLPVVLMSDVRVRQLLTNLVDNALKHGGRDDLTVTVSALTTAGGVVVDVADDGRGIPAEYRDRVLRVFERLDAARATSGTGMGLAICKRIVESVGGALSVGGPADGTTSGTTVSIELPPAVVADPSLPIPREPSTPSPERTTVKERT
jgi:signal transduction histidine kinase